MKYKLRSDINFLRMLAVMSVIINHISPTKLAGGYLGVDVFFVISAFLISSLLLREYTRSGTINLVDFYKKRIFRIAPALSVVLLFTLVASFSLLYYDVLQKLSLSSAFSNLGFANIYFWKFLGLDSFNSIDKTTPFLHLWSLGVVWQFYFLFPIVLLLLWRLKKLFVYLLCLAFVASLILATVLDHYDFVYYNLLTRAFELIAGVLASIYMHSKQPSNEEGNGYQNLIISLLSLAIIAFSMIYLGSKYRLPNHYSLIVVLPTVGLLVSEVGENSFLQRIYRLKIFQLLGMWSYSIYLWLWVLLALAKTIWGLDLPPHINYIILFGSIVVGALSYYLVEQKTRYLNWSFKKGLIVFVLVPLLCYFYVIVFTRTINQYTRDKLHEILAMHANLAYLNLFLTLIFYGLVIAYFLNKMKSKYFYKNLFILTLLSITIALGWRFMAPEFIDSTPIRVLMHPNYLVAFIYDTTVLLTIFMFLLQIPRIGSYLVYLAIIFVFIYNLVAFTTFFHLKRLPSAIEFKLGGQILFISPFSYIVLAIRNKSLLFIISYVIPLIVIIIGLNKIELRQLRIKPFFSIKILLLPTIGLILALGLSVTEMHIKKNRDFYGTSTTLNQMINQIGLFKYQLRLLKSNIVHKNDYQPEKLKKEVNNILKKYSADRLELHSSMPQIILSWAYESFMSPERLDPTLTNQNKINPNFKRLLKQGVANGISSSFPLKGGGTPLGESTLLANMQLSTPKQNHPSLVSYYESLGYTTIYMHVVFDTFANYQERSKFYGFDEVYLGSYFNNNWGDDKALFALIRKRIAEAITNNEKLFISFIDIGRHAPHDFYSSQPELLSELTKTYSNDDEGILHYIYKGNIVDSYLGDLINFIDSQKISIALMLNADHVPDGFKKNYDIEGDESRYMSEFLFYHNQKKLELADNYKYIHQSLVPSLFLKTLGMPLRSLDKYIIDQSNTQKTYKLSVMEQLPYDIALGQQISKPLFELKE